MTKRSSKKTRVVYDLKVIAVILLFFAICASLLFVRAILHGARGAMVFIILAVLAIVLIRNHRKSNR